MYNTLTNNPILTLSQYHWLALTQKSMDVIQNPLVTLVDL